MRFAAAGVNTIIFFISAFVVADALFLGAFRPREGSVRWLYALVPCRVGEVTPGLDTAAFLCPAFDLRDGGVLGLSSGLITMAC